MKRTLKIALSVVLGAAMVVPALAQDAFPDTPENHWAYEALREMKNNGLLVGYPDGLFRGPRPASRYELAVAIHATYKHLKNITDGLNGRIDDLKKVVDNIKPGSAGVSQAELDNLKQAISALQTSQKNMQAWGDDIANLKKLAATFEKELSSMGVDVEALKKGMSDLADRVGVLEKKKLPVDIHGDLTFFGAGGYSTSDRFGLRVDGQPTGYGRGAYNGAPVGANRDFSVFHEAALSLSGTNEEGPKWGTTVVVGNMLGPGGNFTQSTSAVSPFDEALNSTDIYIQDAWVTFDTSLVGQGFNATVGRFGKKLNGYVFKRPDVTPYMDSQRWDNGKWAVDGGNLGFKFGGASLEVFGGNTTPNTVNGGLQGMSAGRLSGPNPNNAGLTMGALDIHRMLGAALSVPLSSQGELNLAYLWLDSDNVVGTSNGPANRVNVFGGDLGFKFGAVKVEGGYSQSDVNYNSTGKVTDDNAAWWVKAGFGGEKWGVKGWYRNIEPLFGAPGDWGRLGTWWNPTDIKGYGAAAHINLSDDFRLYGGAEMYEGLGGPNSTLVSTDEFNRYTAGLGYKVNDNWHLGLGWESLEVKSASFGGLKPREVWYNVGLDYNLGANSSLSFLWQISDFDGKGTGFAPGGFDRQTGGLITTQLSVRF
jgi:hypothetical protein